LPERQERTEGRKYADVEESLGSGRWRLLLRSASTPPNTSIAWKLFGELTLTPDSIEFSSREHYFKHGIESVQVDGNGIRTATARSGVLISPAKMRSNNCVCGRPANCLNSPKQLLSANFAHFAPLRKLFQLTPAIQLASCHSL